MPSSPKDTLWPIEPHTLAKHAILRKYLEAWYPIMTRYHGHVMYVDGFAGPGEYSTGKKGSPLLAIDTWRDHTHAGMRAKDITFHFIESRSDRAQHLRSRLSNYDRPPTAHWIVHEGDFDPTFNALLTQMTSGGQVRN